MSILVNQNHPEFMLRLKSEPWFKIELSKLRVIKKLSLSYTRGTVYFEGKVMHTSYTPGA
jgi:hypothetical protein